MSKKLLVVTILVVAFFIISRPMVSADELETIYETVDQEIIAKGLVYEHKSKLTEAGWVDIHVLRTSLNEPTLSLDVIRNQETYAGLSGLSKMANSDTRFVGGINGSFFRLGFEISDAEGYEFRENEISFLKNDANTTLFGNATLMQLLDGTVNIDFVSSTIHLKTSSGGVIYIQGINNISNIKNPVVINRTAYENSSAVDQIDSFHKLVIDNNVITKIASPEQVVDIPEEGYIVIFQEFLAESILRMVTVGQVVELEVATNIDESLLSMAISGGGLIYKEDSEVEEGLIVSGQSRHPRTAVGITQDGSELISMVVDGRGESIGASHNELASYLKEYNVVDAMHMDGGGSSTMSARPLGAFEMETYNLPSDGKERSIVNGLGFVSTTEESQSLNLFLKTKSKRVFLDSIVELELIAYDDNFRPIEIDKTRIAWSIAGGFGTMDQANMSFKPLDTGDITLSAYYSGKEAKLVIKVVDELIDLQVNPKLIYANDGITEFNVVGIDTEGYEVELDNELLEWSIDPEYGTINNGIFVGKSVDKLGVINIQYKDIQEVAYVANSSYITEVIDLNGMAVDSLVYPSSVKGNAFMNVAETGNELVIDFEFPTSDVSQAVYAEISNVVISEAVNQLYINGSELDGSVLLKAHVIDGFGERASLSFSRSDDQYIADLSSGLTYPLTIERLYIVSLAREELVVGTFRINELGTGMWSSNIEEKDLRYYGPVDSLYDVNGSSTYKIKVFGATGGRNRLLDDIVLSKVYEEFNKSDFSVYAGKSDVNMDVIKTPSVVYKDQFSVHDLEDVRLITLGMSQGSMVRTDYTQWELLNDTLATTLQSSIIILGTEALIDNSDQSFTREGELIHATLSSFSKKSGKVIFYVNASGYKSNLKFYEGIRYIDTNGLWYKVEDNRSVDLYDNFKVLEFDVIQGKLTYNIKDLYPKTNVTSN